MRSLVIKRVAALVIFILAGGYTIDVLLRARSDDGIFSFLLELQLRHGTPINLEPAPWVEQMPLLDQSKDRLIDAIPFSLYEHRSEPVSNPYINQLIQCFEQPNKYTEHIRLGSSITTTAIRNISLSLTDALSNADKQYFNPTIIPLPSWSPHPYLLVSRLVTTGLHQESHICLADYCIPPALTSSLSPQQHKRKGHLPPGVRSCTTQDLEVLGPGGGLRCATKAEKLNIPPTPALRCEGSWAAFPDIPGFHDPRVFWSGNGEPLMIVNSGSQYGCVGLWVVDLRVVYPALAELMSQKEGVAGGAKVRFSTLTEITRNPRGDRSGVEKNWVLSFPEGEEVWVQYDLVKHGYSSVPTNLKEPDEDNDVMAQMDEDGVHGRGDYRTSDDFGMALPKTKSDSVVNANLSALFHEPETASISSHSMKSPLSISLTNTTALYTNKSTSPLRLSSLTNRDQDHIFPPPRPPPTQPFPHHPSVSLTASRSLAKLIGAGLTTPNLTSPFESPCFNSFHIHDTLGNTGYWHQGSNSLRLVLCHRVTASSASIGNKPGDDCELTDENESELVSQGRVVHVMVMHRKFSNEMQLPMRYERYFIVWESRWPFRVVGVSRFPVLFAGERARPWSIAENWPGLADEDGVEEDKLDKREELSEEEKNVLKEERKKWEGVYFTYTPSLAWAWRGRTNDDDQAQRRLGTGYLGDDVLVGIGMDDIMQGVVRVQIDELLQCLRLCPDFDGDAEIVL